MTKSWLSMAVAGLTMATAWAGPVLAQVPAAPEPSPYQLNLLYTGEAWDNAAGGLKQGSTYMYNADARLSVDTERAFGWTGGRFVAEGFYESHNSLDNRYVGALDQQSPIDSACCAMWRIYQVFYDQVLGNTDLLFGIYDLETDFSTTRPMALFLNKNLTWNTALDQSGTMPQNGVVGPGNYPYTPLAFRIRQTLDPRWSVQAVIADGAADNPKNPAENGVFISPQYGLMAIAEVDYTPNPRTKVMAGAWELTSRLPANDLTDRNGSPRPVWGEQGAYFGGATRLYSPGGRRGLDGFLTLGLSSPVSTNVGQSLNGGLVYTGLWPTRPNDKTGISFAENANPASYRQGQAGSGQPVDRYETGFEVTYRARVCDWLTIQPDAQYIIHPNYDPALRNDLVIGLHFEIGRLFDL